VNAAELGDRLAIARGHARYATALDEKDWPLLDEVFAPGARLLYDMGDGARESRWPEMAAAFRAFTERFRCTQHLLGLPEIDLDGERALSRTSLRALHVQETPEGTRSAWLVYGGYRDRHERTARGWRIVEREFRCLHTEGELLPAERVRRFARPPWSQPGT
jgi:hypothetical protein